MGRRRSRWKAAIRDANDDPAEKGTVAAEAYRRRRFRLAPRAFGKKSRERSSVRGIEGLRAQAF
jgi:hypothetical protein